MSRLPSLRVTGHRVWSRLRHGGDAGQAKLLSALQKEAERVGQARTKAERAAQLARVLDVVTALAEAHGIDEAELTARRAQPARGMKHLKQRASSVVAHVWGRSGVYAATAPSGAQVDSRAHWTATLALRVRTPFALGVGRPHPAAGLGGRTQLIAASLLHLPRLQRQVMTLRRRAGAAMSPAKLVRSPVNSLVMQHVAAASILLVSGRSGLRLTYELASAGAQLWLRRYVLPRVLRRANSGVAGRTIEIVRPLRLPR